MTNITIESLQHKVEKTEYICKLLLSELKEIKRLQYKTHETMYDIARVGTQPDRVLSPKDTAYMLATSTSTLYVIEEEDEDFPRRVQITERRFGWRYSDLIKYIEMRTLKGSIL